MASTVIWSRWRNRAHASAGQTIRAAARIWPWLQHSAAGLTAPRKASKTASPQASAGPLRTRLEQHSSAELAQLLDTLRQTYHRRRNLMLLLNQAF
jgi:hypothetical protein